MATEVVMPKLGLTMETGTIGAWLVATGAAVVKGQPLLEIITDKVTMEVEAQADGHLLKTFYAEGEEVAVSQLIGLIGTPEEDISAYGEAEADPTPIPSAEHIETTPGPDPTMVSNETGPEPAVSSGERPHRASPKARKIAAERGIDLRTLTGSGAGGRVVSADLEGVGAASVATTRSNEGGQPSVAQLDTGGLLGDFVALNPAERVAADRLTESYRQTPHIHLLMDVSALWLEQFRQGYRLEGKSISYNDLIVSATARALGDFPRINSHYSPGGYVPQKEINIGVAVAADRGLVVPVLRQVDQKTVEEVAEASVRLVDQARRGALSLDDMQGGTFTISNLGMLGVSRFTAIINPPQVAILAVGAIERRVVALDGDAVAVRPFLTLTLAADHRVVDGALGARFLGRLRDILQTPGLLG